jgi:hypothetical protein
MALEAGSIKVRISGDVTDLQTALNNLNDKLEKTKNSTKGVGGEMLKANIVFAGLKKAADLVVKGISDSINAFKGAELASARLSSLVGGSISQFSQFASEIQRMTTVEGDAVIEMQTLAKTLGVANENLNETAKQAISLSKAFGIDLNQATKYTVFAQQGNYEALQRLIPALRTTKDEAERQAIINEAMAKGWTLATAEANTFTGKLTQLGNEQGDVMENTGAIISVIGMDFVNAMLEGTRAINDYIASAQGIDTISNIAGVSAGIFETAKNIFVDLGASLKDNVLSIVTDLKNRFFELVGSGDKTNYIMITLAGATKLIGITFGITSRLIKIFIDNTINLAGILKEAGVSIGKFFEALFSGGNQKKWDAFNESIDNTKKAIGRFATDLKDNIGDVINNTIKDFQKLPTETLKTADQWAKDYKAKVQEISNATRDALSGGGETPVSTQVSNKPVEDAKKKAIELQNVFTDSQTSISNSIGNIWNSSIKGFDDVFNTFSDKSATIGEKIQAIFSAVGGTISQTLSQIQSLIQSQNDAAIQSLTDRHNAEIGLINDRLAKEIELIENDGMTKEEKRQKDIELLQNQLATETDSKKQADLQQQISNLEKEKKIEEAKKKSDEAKKKSDKDYAMAKYNMEKEQFEISKGFQIAQVWIQYAIGVAAAWAQSIAQLGPIAGSIMAGVLTGILTGVAVGQTVAISQQQMPPAPSFETGGIVPGTSYRGDNVIARVNSGEMILNAEQQAALFAMANRSGGGNQTINLIVDGNILKTWFIENQRREAYLFG